VRCIWGSPPAAAAARWQPSSPTPRRLAARRRAALIIAGDFNDWRNHADDQLIGPLGLSEVFHLRGRPARSFPSTLPVLRLDRIYVRVSPSTRPRCTGPPWSRISDHAALTAHLRSALSRWASPGCAATPP
jgi:endonuclease/exonuclease/phosphatase family metal-dependent hydrolase